MDTANTSLDTPGTLAATFLTWNGGRGTGYRATFDTSQQRLRLSIPEDVDGRFSIEPFSDREVAPPLTASLAEATSEGDFHSASLLAFKAKQFDDGLYAAVELAVDGGTENIISRRKLLEEMASALQQIEGSGRDGALALLAAATRVGGHPITVDGNAEELATALQESFLSNALQSKPLGFYTWNEDLARVFRRDRLLQTSLEPEQARMLTDVLTGELLAHYKAALELPRRLTNAYAKRDLAAAAERRKAGQSTSFDGDDFALFPPSRAHETELIKRLYGQLPIPDGFVLADEMIRRIQAGTLTLEPQSDSGWYDYQTYALEPLVVPDRMPEARHLLLDASYEKELTKLFKALLALTRETHIKQLEEPLAGAMGPMLPEGLSFEMAPQLSQEPVASYYLRRAHSYRFVRTLLATTFGNEAFAAMKRLTANGAVDLALDQELAFIESLFYGAYVNTALELGMTPEADATLGSGPKQSLAVYRAWLPGKDPDVGQDIRTMVPLFYDVVRRKVKVWVVLGVTTKPLDICFERAPELISLTDEVGTPVDLADVHMDYSQSRFSLAYPVMTEIYVTDILNREEFRALCDRHKTQPDILRALQ